MELCLTVPVRLSSLLPYLPMLMDPLVSALNGSQTLVSQGLRTLELCVDNLQPDFLYDHIQPVRAELMQVYTQSICLSVSLCLSLYLPSLSLSPVSIFLATLFLSLRPSVSLTPSLYPSLLYLSPISFSL